MAGMGRADVCAELLKAGARASLSSSTGLRPADLARRAAERKEGATAVAPSGVFFDGGILGGDKNGMSTRDACLALSEHLASVAETEDRERIQEGKGEMSWFFSPVVTSVDEKCDVWQPFFESNSAELESAHEQGEDELVMQIAGQIYEVSLQHLYQKNVDTGTIRRIDRHFKSDLMCFAILFCVVVAFFVSIAKTL